MGWEIEIKLRVDDPGALRARLRAMGARWRSTVAEENTLFDTGDGQLRAGDCGLRVRTARPVEDAGPRRATLTYKGPRETGAGATKRRREWETVVGDPEAVRGMLRELGYRPAVVFEKRRETWALGEVQVLLDELPRLGWFVEIEGHAAEALDGVCRELGLDPGAALRETYVDMAARHGSMDESGARVLRFAAGEGPAGAGG